jgi:hypothetical protein
MVNGLCKELTKTGFFSLSVMIILFVYFLLRSYLLLYVILVHKKQRSTSFEMIERHTRPRSPWQRSPTRDVCVYKSTKSIPPFYKSPSVCLLVKNASWIYKRRWSLAMCTRALNNPPYNKFIRGESENFLFFFSFLLSLSAARQTQTNK